MLLHFRLNVVAEMRERLPPYIVECFLVSGFDDIDAIVEMNTDDGPKNTISVVESFIDKRKANLPQCMGLHQMPNDPFEFPPGHRLRIKKFVSEMKCQNGITNTTKQMKTKPKSKKQKVENTDSENEGDDSIPTVKDEIRKKIAKWSTKNCDNTLKENVHYTINVQRTLDGSKLTASIRCHCGKAMMIQRKSDGSRPWQLSNWTKHYSVKIRKKQLKSRISFKGSFIKWYLKKKPITLNLQSCRQQQ